MQRKSGATPTAPASRSRDQDDHPLRPAVDCSSSGMPVAMVGKRGSKPVAGKDRHHVQAGLLQSLGCGDRGGDVRPESSRPRRHRLVLGRTSARLAVEGVSRDIDQPRRVRQRCEQAGVHREALGLVAPGDAPGDPLPERGGLRHVDDDVGLAHCSLPFPIPAQVAQHGLRPELRQRRAPFGGAREGPDRTRRIARERPHDLLSDESRCPQHEEPRRHGLSPRWASPLQATARPEYTSFPT
jgi:hypothetical protein